MTKKRYITALKVGDVIVLDDLLQFIDWNDKMKVTKIYGDIVEMVGLSNGTKYISTVKALICNCIYG